MFLSELFDKLDEDSAIPLPDLKGVPEKALSILSRLAKFHQVKNLSYDRQKNIWTASNSDGVEPFIRDAKRITSAAGMGVAININNESEETDL